MHSKNGAIKKNQMARYLIQSPDFFLTNIPTSAIIFTDKVKTAKHTKTSKKIKIEKE